MAMNVGDFPILDSVCHSLVVYERLPKLVPMIKANNDAIINYQLCVNMRKDDNLTKYEFNFITDRWSGINPEWRNIKPQTQSTYDNIIKKIKDLKEYTTLDTTVQNPIPHQIEWLKDKNNEELIKMASDAVAYNRSISKTGGEKWIVPFLGPPEFDMKNKLKQELANTQNDWNNNDWSTHVANSWRGKGEKTGSGEWKRPEDGVWGAPEKGFGSGGKSGGWGVTEGKGEFGERKGKGSGVWGAPEKGFENGGKSGDRWGVTEGKGEFGGWGGKSGDMWGVTEGKGEFGGWGVTGKGKKNGESGSDGGAWGSAKNGKQGWSVTKGKPVGGKNHEGYEKGDWTGDTTVEWGTHSDEDYPNSSKGEWGGAEYAAGSGAGKIYAGEKSKGFKGAITKGGYGAVNKIANRAHYGPYGEWSNW
jgi:hypothetical protein